MDTSERLANKAVQWRRRHSLLYEQSDESTTAISCCNAAALQSRPTCFLHIEQNQHTLLSRVYTMQPVVQPVVQRLYRENTIFVARSQDRTGKQTDLDRASSQTDLNTILVTLTLMLNLDL